jgi:hypothetical protein
LCWCWYWHGVGVGIGVGIGVGVGSWDGVMRIGSGMELGERECVEGFLRDRDDGRGVLGVR